MKKFLFASILLLFLLGTQAYPSFTKPRLLQETTSTSGDITFPANSFTIEDYFEVYYEFAPEGNITFAIKFNAGDQFFALGLGTQMMGADIWIFQIENSELVAGDYLGVGHTTPTQDTVNNLEILGYEIAADYTIVKFTRALDTGDSSDVAISLGATNFIWATASGSPTLGYHQSNRGTLQVDLVETVTGGESESEGEGTSEEGSSNNETEGEGEFSEEDTEVWEFCPEEGEYISETETEIVVSEENLLLDL